MQLLVLAAGMGKRLDPLTRDVPKCLVEVNGTPIIINALDIVTQDFISRIVIVVGHLGGKVKAALGCQYKGVPIEYVENPIYDKTNNIYSLWLARGYFDEDTILMEADVYFEPELISRLRASPHTNIALLDRFQSHMDGTVVTVDESGELSAMIPASAQTGNFDFTDTYKTVNLYCFTAAYLQNIFQPALQDYIGEHGRDIYYELVIAALVTSGAGGLRAEIVAGTKWIEIDDFVDLERAEILFCQPDQLYEKVRGLHGGFWRYGFVDHCYLYNLNFPPPPLLAEIKRNIRPLLCGYPSGSNEILNYLGNWLSVDPINLAIGNGASEIIAVLKRSMVNRMTLAVPSFNEYSDGLTEERLNLYYSENDDFVIDVDRFVESVEQSESNIAVLVNPDLPSGQLLRREQLHHLCNRLAHLDVMVVDESFIEFASVEENHSLLPDLHLYPNLLVIRSMSKDLGVPGLRLGFAASADPRLIRVLRGELPIWNINGVAEYFLAVLTKYRAEFHDACAKVIADRAYFYGELMNIEEIKVFESAANFIMVKLPPGCDSSSFTRHLFINGDILVKDCSNKPGLKEKSWLRLAVRNRADTDEFIPKFRNSLLQLMASNSSQGA